MQSCRRAKQLDQWYVMRGNTGLISISLICLTVDPWEALHDDYLETAKVLDHFEHEINTVRGGIETSEGKKKARIALLAGADLIQTMSSPGVWAPKDIDYILGNFGAFIIEVCQDDHCVLSRFELTFHPASRNRH